MPIEIIIPSSGKHRIVTDIEGNEYNIQMFLNGGDYLIPYNRNNKYWEHHFVPRETWIPIEAVDYSRFNFTREEYLELKAESDENTKKIFEKYWGSF